MKYIFKEERLCMLMLILKNIQEHNCSKVFFIILIFFLNLKSFLVKILESFFCSYTTIKTLIDLAKKILFGRNIIIQYTIKWSEVGK